LRIEPEGPTYDVDGEGAVAALEVAAVHDTREGRLTLFAVNRLDAPLPIRALLRDLGGVAVEEHLVLADPDLTASNTSGLPDRVVPANGTGAHVQDRELTAELPPRSWTVLRLARAS
jgi:alpha-N-arabinofuranosidase